MTFLHNAELKIKKGDKDIRTNLQESITKILLMKAYFMADRLITNYRNLYDIKSNLVMSIGRADDLFYSITGIMFLQIALSYMAWVRFCYK